MASADASAIADHITGIADYDALREVASQLAGLLWARQSSESAPEAAAAWRQERLGLLAWLDEIQPGTPAVSQALQQWSARLAALRRDAV